MATILLSAAGAAVGSSLGGTFLGLSMTAVGRFAGATLGRALDQRIMGAGSETVETGRVERIRLTGAGEGAPIAEVYGRMRVGGHVIWAAPFQEHTRTRGGGRSGKMGPPKPKIREVSYSVSLAIALGEGVITHVPRIWADGVEVAPNDLNMRLYSGTLDQMPDPLIAAHEGDAPGFRGTAYVVMEDLDLGQFGNRVPQFSFEVTRPDPAEGLAQDVRGVAMIPGSGEYALATTPVHYDYGNGANASANRHTPSGMTDFSTSLQQLTHELPNCGATSLVVSWFGDDLRAGSCRISPKVEQKAHDGKNMKWNVAGLSRQEAALVTEEEGRPVYGGTPTDRSVIEAITALREAGQAVMYYPFILMDQAQDNALPDPYGSAAQAALPWRGRITTALAPDQPGSSDGSAAAEAEVAAFFGTVRAADFTVSDGKVGYDGPDEWSYTRFILHQAALAAAAGGVDSFCIGSEMRGLTQIRGAGESFPAVTRLIALAAEVRALLPGAKLGYAADWSEYFGYMPQDGSGDRYFHLDPLWADANIDFIGIDNYMPLSDWREGSDHRDAETWESIYDLDYLASNIEGGEGYDWFYHSEEARAAQIRTPITDGEGEPWIWRVKDMRGWWQNPHYERRGGMRQAAPTPWVPRSKPIWFTEIGCAALDKGTNQPNKFLDPKSSESALPYFSDGRRDPLIQAQYVRAMTRYWDDPAHNPASDVYEGRMIDTARTFVWAWDARPFPWFPGLRDLWTDGGNYARGHWLNGRTSSRTLASVVGEICRNAGVEDIDLAGLHGMVRGYAVSETASARAALQPLLLAHGVDAVEAGGQLRFRMRGAAEPQRLDPARLAVTPDLAGREERTRAGAADVTGRVRVRFVEAGADYDVLAEEAVLPDAAHEAVSGTDLPLVLSRAEGRAAAERWLAEARVARESLRLALPPSQLALGPGDVIALGDAPERYRVDRIEEGAGQIVEAVRVDDGVYRPGPGIEAAPQMRPFVPPLPVLPVLMDLPLITGEEAPHQPHLAVTADPWPGAVAVYDSLSDTDYTLREVVAARAGVGTTETPLAAVRPGRRDRGPALVVQMTSGTLSGVSDPAFLAGANLMAIGDGSAERWELFSFRDAELVGPGRWALRHRLRGIAGSDAIMPDVWPVGSRVVVVDERLSLLDLPPALRGVLRHYRIGPAGRPHDDPAYRTLAETVRGAGLRPYAPCHLRARKVHGGLELRWLRRTRLAAPSWIGTQPLGEEREAYSLRIWQGSELRREVALTAPQWVYDTGLQNADTGGAPFTIEVAQVSALWGAGPGARLELG